MPRPSNRDGEPPAVVDVLRNLLLGSGLAESHARDQEGFYIIAESHDEVSVQFQEAEHEGASMRSHGSRPQVAAFLKLCGTLAQMDDRALTLFVSPRSLALFVRVNSIGNTTR